MVVERRLETDIQATVYIDAARAWTIVHAEREREKHAASTPKCRATHLQLVRGT